jgi:hypothetical protein
MSWRFAACVTLAMTVMVSSVLAQEEGARRQRGGQGGGQGGGQRGAFGGGMMGMGRGTGGASQIIGLLRMEEVRKEVAVSEDVYKSASESLQEDQRKLFQRDISDEDRKKISAELDTKAQGIMEEILTPENQKRLMGLYAQNAGARAVVNTVIAKEIGLSDSERANLEKELQTQAEKMGEKMREQFAGGGGERPDFTKMQEAMAKMQEETNKFVEGKLTADQKKALETLKGKKFKFPEQRGFGFGGGAGGGRGGAEGGGGRGGEQGSTRPRGDGN